MDAPLGEWIGATVHRDGGVFGAKPYSLPTGFQGYLMNQARKVVTANKSIPSDQRVRIDAKGTMHQTVIGRYRDESNHVANA